MVRSIVRDTKSALRALVTRPLYTSTSVLCLAVGLACAVATFSFVHAVLFQPLPYGQPDGLFRVSRTNPEKGWDWIRVSPEEVVTWQRSAENLAGVAAYRTATFTMDGAGAAERVWAVQASTNLFRVLGVEPLHGRTFTPDDEGVRIAVLSHPFWSEELGADEQVLGRSIVLDGSAHTVVGVMAAEFEFPPDESYDLWVPARPAFSARAGSERTDRSLYAIGRLAEGITPSAAQQELALLAADVGRDDPSVEGWGVSLHRLRDDLTQFVRRPLLVLLCGAVLLLLISLINAGHLVLVRGMERRQELAMRGAMGASRWDLWRPSLIEGLLKAALAGICALGLAVLFLEALAGKAPDRVPRLDDASSGGVVSLVLLGAVVLIGLLLGATQFFAGFRSDLRDALGSGAHSLGGSRRVHRSRKSMIAGEVAVGVVLSVAALLLARSYLGVVSVDPGFDLKGVMTAQVYPSGAEYRDPERRSELYRRMTAALDRLPAVRSAAVVDFLPLTGGGSLVSVEGPGGEMPTVLGHPVSSAYFEGLDVPVRGGRELPLRRFERGGPVAIINEVLAERQFGQSGAVGRSLAVRESRVGGGGGERRILTVVGVVGRVKHWGLDRPAPPILYVPLDEDPPASAAILVEGNEDLVLGAEEVERALREVDPEVPVYRVRPAVELVGESMGLRRFSLLLLVVYGVAGVALAGIGVYGLIAYVVAQRMPEIGLRVALGASRSVILRETLRVGLGPTALGLGAGLLVAGAGARALESMIYGIGARDPVSFGLAALILGGVAVITALIPAWRAARIDPVDTLKHA